MKTIKKESCVKNSGLTKMVLKPLALSIALLSASTFVSPTMAAETLAEAFSGGKAFANLRLRYESADQDEGVGRPSADALTLRTTFGYHTDEYKGFSVLVEAEDVREVLGVNDFSVGPANVRPGQFDVIADPETTELDQAFVQYKSGGLTAKLGRQVIALDGHRFIGHVGWRQDRQTFDALSIDYKVNDDFSIKAAQIVKRNRIFGEEADIDSQDTLLNASFNTSYGKFVTYGYLLEVDDVPNTSLDTYGISFTGSTKLGENKVSYTAEYATQDNDATNTESDYLNLGASITVSGIKASLGYEVLGSDNGVDAFATPLATLHKFNGWADVFLNTPNAGLEDLSLTLDAKFGGGNFKVAYHDFSADESTVGGNDLGDEFDIQYTRNFGKHLYSGIKYANYSQGSSAASPIDTERFWLWVGVKFK